MLSISAFQITCADTNTNTFNSLPPAAEKFNTELVNNIQKMQLQRSSHHKPRTKHLSPEGQAKYINRLYLQSSPYLLQHAHNPVNWYPWGDEAFLAAAKLNRPILLSVGYSTCHWCHVMEEESFEDLEIASFINANYIAIKVDREERPDIDAIYMAALHAMGKNTGWPMNVWLTPDRKPFYGGTYFPARDGDRGENIGLLSLLTQLKLIYETQPEKINETSRSLEKFIQQSLVPVAGSTLPAANIMEQAIIYYKNNFDSFYGGIGNAPKFPSTTPFQFLLRYYHRTQDKEVLNIINLSLTKMSAGGIYDHIGGGFHRYSIDNEWLVPHFEKMLYDNALLSIDYLEAYQVTKDKNFKRITNETLHYIMRDMTSDSGGFYSATDADSVNSGGETEEGYFFTWDHENLKSILEKKNYEIFSQYYAISKNGNFEGRNILNTPLSLKTFSKNHNISINKLKKIITQSGQKLYQHRQKKPPPLRDEKIITAWNGLMISAFAKAGLVLNNKEYIKQAVKTSHFILNNLYKQGRLYRSFKDGRASHNAYLNDYTFLIAGLLDLYEATYNLQWLNKAIELDQILHEQFEDKKHGGFYMTSHDHEKLLAREKPSFDSALPTGNSVQALNLLRLSEYTSKSIYRTRAEKTFKSFSSVLNTNPIALSKMLIALDFYYDNTKEIVIITPENKQYKSEKFIAILRDQFLPNRTLSVIAEGKDLITQGKTISIAQGKVAINKKATAYICVYGACKLPTTNAEIFTHQINEKSAP